MYSEVIGIFILFLLLPLLFNRVLGWQGAKAPMGLIIIAGLYWLYIWYLD